MQRMINQLLQAHERGATIVTFALLMTVMLGFMGLGIDGAALYAKRQHVQTGADASAFALAQEYALLPACPSEGAMKTKALPYATANVPNETSSTLIDKVKCGVEGGVPFVQVVASAEQPPFFLQAVGAGSIRVPASATVEWGTPIEGTSVIPLAISSCTYFNELGDAEVGAVRDIYIPSPSDPAGTLCPYPATYPKGGFSWLDPTSGCSAFTSIGGWVGGNTGENVPSPECNYPDFSTLLGKTVLLPVFDDVRNPGANAEYHIAGYAAVVLRGFYFGSLSGGSKSGGAACTDPNPGMKTCILVEFKEYVTMDEEFVLGPVTNPDTLIIRLKD